MKKFNSIKSRYIALGVTEDNLDFAINGVLEGTKREVIIETLTEDYRGMSETQATQLLEALYEANGGEFKKENRQGYLYGIVFTLIGITSAVFLVTMLITQEGKSKFLIIALAGTVFGLTQGPILIFKSLKGKFRDEDAPFKE